MSVHRVTRILNVSDVAASPTWFQALGWKRRFTWNEFHLRHPDRHTIRISSGA